MACCSPGRHPIRPVKDPAISAFVRRVRRTQRDRSVLAGRDRFATFVPHDEVMQQLYGVGLALQAVSYTHLTLPTKRIV